MGAVLIALCPACGAELTVSPTYTVGTRARCGGCRQRLQIDLSGLLQEAPAVEYVSDEEFERANERVLNRYHDVFKKLADT